MSEETHPQDGPAVGSVAEEAARLLGVLSAWAQEHDPPPGPAGPGDGTPDPGAGPGAHREADREADRGPAAGVGPAFARMAGEAADAARDLDAHIAADEPECRWCPVCRAVHLVRACTPEVRDQLATAAANLMQAAATLVTAAATRERRDRPQGEQMQHIDLDDGPEPGGRP